MYTYIFRKSIRVIPVSAALSRVPYGYVFLHIRHIRHMGRIPRLHTSVLRGGTASRLAITTDGTKSAWRGSPDVDVRRPASFPQLPDFAR